MMSSAQQPALSPAQRAHELRLGKPLAEGLTESFARLGDADLVAQEFGVTSTTIYRWVRQLGLTTTTRLTVASHKDSDGDTAAVNTTPPAVEAVR